MAFSMAMNGTEARLYITWQEGPEFRRSMAFGSKNEEITWNYSGALKISPTGARGIACPGLKPTLKPRSLADQSEIVLAAGNG
jgi:hypothetical protein